MNSLERLRLRVMRFIASHRDNPLFMQVARFSWAYLDLYENFSYEMELNGELRVLEIAAKDAACVFDVGANVGDYTDEVLTRTNAREVHAFEIVPATAQRLEVRFAQTTRVRVNAFGLADEDGTVSVRYFPRFSVGSSISGYDHGLEDEQSEWVECSIRRGDDYCREQRIELIDLLKIDAEGADLSVLRGFEEMLAHQRIKVIQFEYGRANIVSGDLLSGFAELFERHGYLFGKVFPGSVELRPYSHRLEDLRGPNYVAVAGSEDELIGRLSGSPLPALVGR